jgi:uncharacterized protein
METLLKIIIIVLIIIIYSYFENRNLEVTHYDIKSKRIPEEFDGVKLVVLADLHNNSYGNNNEILLSKIKDEKPDYIIMAGDMVVNNKPNQTKTPLSLISELSKNYPIYYGIGNHEQSLMPGGRKASPHYETYQNELKKLGVNLLINQQETIVKGNESIRITGLMIGAEYFKKLKQPKLETKYLQKLVGIPANQCYNILIAHNPVYFKQYTEWGSDLTFSGHIHGGIVRLPGLGGVISPQYKFFPKYDAGRFDKEGKTLLVSRGLGMHTIKLRMFNRPELMVVTLKRL